MKQITKYVCESCGKEFLFKTDCEVHEAMHYGLTDAEFLEWRNRCRNAASAGKMLAVATNDQTRKTFDRMISYLVDFEDAHNLHNRKRPSDFCL